LGQPDREERRDWTIRDRTVRDEIVRYNTVRNRTDRDMTGHGTKYAGKCVPQVGR